MRTSDNSLHEYRVVRLNATLVPVGEYEAALYDRYHLPVVQVEAATPDEIIPHVADCDALFASSVSLPAEVVESLSRCRVISRLGVGTDKIDVEAATRMGILVTNVPDFCVEDQTDHTMALLLSLSRQIPQMSRAMDDGAWSRAPDLANQNRRLSGRVLGLIGFGNTARAVARRARAFGLEIIATRRRMNATAPEIDELGMRMVDLDTLLAESDIVSLHLPLTTESYHLLDEAALRKMKRGAFLINTSRGALVDEYALVAALRDGHIAGAGIDTFEHIDIFAEEEGGPPDHPLLELDNVVLTPHVAALSVESQQDVSRGGVENVVAVLSGRWPRLQNIVNPGVVPRYPLEPQPGRDAVGGP